MKVRIVEPHCLSFQFSRYGRRICLESNKFPSDTAGPVTILGEALDKLAKIS